jgi:hypothetical protein
VDIAIFRGSFNGLTAILIVELEGVLRERFALENPSASVARPWKRHVFSVSTCHIHTIYIPSKEHHSELLLMLLRSPRVKNIGELPCLENYILRFKQILKCPDISVLKVSWAVRREALEI